jgi:hypothetical protein
MGQDGNARPATIASTVKINAPTISMRPHLWYTWAMIAIRQEHRAWRLRRDGLQQAAFGPYLVQEAHEAMQAVVAARQVLTNLYLVWEETLQLGGEGKLRPAHFTVAELEPGWSKRVLQLISDRNGVVHHEERTVPVELHPHYPSGVSHLEVAFTAERATEAVEVMLNGVLRLAITAPAPALEMWASGVGHVPADLDQRRQMDDDALGEPNLG